MKKRLSLLLTMFVLLCGTSSAVNYDFHIGGVYYRILLKLYNQQQMWKS